MTFKHSWMVGLVLAMGCGVVSCGTVQTRNEIPTHQSEVVTRPESSDATDAPAVPVQPVKSQPKIGLVLGPGGMRSFAHLGFLEQFEKARIPVVGVAGVEWGALVAGLYSVQGKAFDAQWKMLKMTEKDLPSGGGGLFSSQPRVGQIDSLNSFFAGSFGAQTIERSALPFMCPAQNTLSGQVRWFTSGALTQAVQRCMPYPPLFAAKDNSAAAMFAVQEAADRLRQQGATVIVLVDVLADGGLMSAAQAQENYPLYLLWLSVQSQLRGSYKAFDEVFPIRARNKALSDFASRRALVQIGESAGLSAVQYLTKKYGL